jgi:hypothetical protein
MLGIYTALSGLASSTQCAQHKFDHTKKSEPIAIVIPKIPRHDRMSRYLQLYPQEFTDNKPKIPKLCTPHPRKTINALIIEEHAKK